ncbi:hypothetical protein T09_9729 [Trichinella sp. T9]|nr:hypothetical protein T09_9729 [Trichinella sp. T9]
MDGGQRNDMFEEENTARKAVKKNRLKWRRRRHTSDSPEVDPAFPHAVSESALHRMQSRPRKSCTIMGTERHDLFGPVRELLKEILGSNINKFMRSSEIPSGRRTPFASLYKPGPSNYRAKVFTRILRKSHAAFDCACIKAEILHLQTCLEQVSETVEPDRKCSNDSEMKSKSSLYSESGTMEKTSLNESGNASIQATEVMDENLEAAYNQTSRTQYKPVEKCRMPGGSCDLPAFAGYGYCIYHTPQMKFIQCRYDAGTRVNRCPNGVADVRFGLCDEHKMALVEIVLAEKRAAKLEGGYTDGRKFRAFLRRLKLPTYSSGYGTNFDDSFSTDSDSETEDGVPKCATPDYDYSAVIDDDEPLSCLGLANLKKLIRVIHDEKGTKRNRFMDYIELELLSEQQRREAQKPPAPADRTPVENDEWDVVVISDGSVDDDSSSDEDFELNEQSVQGNENVEICSSSDENNLSQQRDDTESQLSPTASCDTTASPQVIFSGTDKNENLSEDCVQPNYSGPSFLNELSDFDHFIHRYVYPEMEQAYYLAALGSKKTSQPLLSLIGRKRIPPLYWNTYYRRAKRLKTIKNDIDDCIKKLLVLRQQCLEKFIFEKLTHGRGDGGDNVNCGTTKSGKNERSFLKDKFQPSRIKSLIIQAVSCLVEDYLEPLYEIGALNDDVFKSIVIDFAQFLTHRFVDL